VALPTRTSPRQARSAKSLDLILDAAERLFHERGVVETSTVDVAAAAQVSVGRLYYWFPDKDAVTNAVMQRAEQRLREFLGKVIVDVDEPTPDLLDRVVPALGAFFREHPGSLAVLVRGPVDPVDHGGSMCAYMESLAAAVVEARVPGIPAAERDLVATTITRIVIGMMAEHVHADLEFGNVVLIELRYVLAAYLHCRYPYDSDPVWTNPDEPIRPSRRPIDFDRPSVQIRPALSDAV
jgi:AcrR family transcriptional regulator